MGGKAASQGTGITSGLDEKVNMTNGRANYADGPTTYQDYLNRALSKMEQRDKAISGMDSLINLGAAQRAGQVLSTEESNNPLDIFLNLARAGTEIALPSLSEKKKLQLKQLDPTTDLAVAKMLKPTGGFGEKVYQMKLRNLGELEKQEDELRTLLKEEKIDPAQFENEMNKIIIRKKIAVGGSFKTDEDYIDAAREYLTESQGAFTNDQLIKKAQEFKSLGSRILEADGGRVDRQMGSPMMGEQPMQQGMGMEQQDVAMETQNNQGNKVYDMLRARLPQEVSDEVVKLISYNKEAFGDFASIKNQEDVNSFNEKYGVQLVIDVATV
jgi:hypothetical protein